MSVSLTEAGRQARRAERRRLEREAARARQQLTPAERRQADALLRRLADADRRAVMDETRPGYLLPMRQTVLAFTGVMLGMFVAALNQTIVVTALPTIVSDLGGAEHYSWVFSAYMLGATVTCRSTGGCRTSTGGGAFFVLGIVLFVAGGRRRRRRPSR